MVLSKGDPCLPDNSIAGFFVHVASDTSVALDAVGEDFLPMIRFSHLLDAGFQQVGKSYTIRRRPP